MPPLRQQPSRIDRPSPLTPETQPRNTRDDIRLPIVKIRTSGTWRAVIVDGGRATVLASPSSWERRLSSGQSRHQSLASIRRAQSHTQPTIFAGTPATRSPLTLARQSVLRVGTSGPNPARGIRPGKGGGHGPGIRGRPRPGAAPPRDRPDGSTDPPGGTTSLIPFNPHGTGPRVAARIA